MSFRQKWLAVLTQRGKKPPSWLKFRSSERFIITVCALAVFTDMFLYGIIVPVIPFALETRIHVHPDRVQYWVSVLIAVYGAALLAFSPVCGWLADHSSSRRSSLLLGLLALLGATVLLNVGKNTAVLCVGRVLQGSSAAVVWVVGLALLADTVPQEKLGQAMGYVSLGMSLGILVAPLLGGVVFEKAGYNAVFAMAYGLIGLDIILRLLLVEKKIAVRWAHTDVQISEGSQVGESGIDVEKTEEQKSAQVVDSASAPAINTNEDPTSSPTRSPLRSRLPPVLSLLYSRRLLVSLYGTIIQAALVTAFDSVLVIHAARVFHWNSIGTALLFLALVVPSFLAPLIGHIADVIGPRIPVTLGFLLAVPPLVCLRFVEENTIQDKVLLCALLAMIGVFLMCSLTPIMAEISAVVVAKERRIKERGEALKGWGKGGAYAQAYGLFNMAFAAGSLVGPLLAGFVVQEHGWPTMAWILALLSGITVIPVCFWVGEGWGSGNRIERDMDAERQ